MNKILLSFVSGMVLLFQCGAQDWALAKLEKSPRHGEWVTLKGQGRDLKCFVVYPEVKNKAAAVLVIHEIFGLTDWVRTVCDRLAEAGYIAIAPDFLSGQTFSGVDEARKAIGGLKPEGVAADLNAAADYAKKLPAGNGNLAVAGFCWGGGQAFSYAQKRNDLKAVFVFYGTGPDKAEDAAKIAAPVYGFYAENDARISATLPATEAAMKEAGKVFDPKIYAGAGHGFMRAGEEPGALEANRKARDEAWERWKSEMLKLLKS